MERGFLTCAEVSRVSRVLFTKIFIAARDKEPIRGAANQCRKKAKRERAHTLINLRDTIRLV
ncbi:hypothetical protein X777_05457 [Ooceraea biroi]|uniref:Uncharacterized protein n=1 Tax=Ooceraea biroi TaxID=2015173 RepID=A0A026X1G4_OOCBI|nr:hypothetical protein X777_05457 [Ooceraea biroi]